METLDEQEFFTGAAANDGADIFGNTALDAVSGAILPPHTSSDSTTPEPPISPGQHAQPQLNCVLQRYANLAPPPVLPTADLTEKFLLTAADPASGSRDERLKRVIRTKYEAGLLKPYNFVKGYSRLLRWLDCKYAAFFLFLPKPLFMFWTRSVSQESKQQILQPLSVLRPKFRVSFCMENTVYGAILTINYRQSHSHYAISYTLFFSLWFERAYTFLSGLDIHRGSLRTLDARIRSLLRFYGYPRMPLAADGRSLQGKPRICGASRRRGIHASGGEFALGCIPSSPPLKFVFSEQGRLCIYELMTEESAVNYWEVCTVLPLRSSVLELDGDLSTRNMATSRSMRRKRRS